MSRSAEKGINEHTGKVGRGAAYLMVGKAATFGLMAVQTIVIPKFFGPEGMGFYSYWLSIFVILGALFDVGGFPILARYLPQYWQTRPAAIRPLLAKVLLVKAPVAAAVIILGSFIFVDKIPYFLLAVLSALIFSISSIVSVIFYARKAFGIFATQSFSRILSKFVLLLFLYSCLKQWGILLAILGASLFTLLAFLPPALRMLPESSGYLPKPFKNYMKFGIWLYAGGSFEMLTRWTIVILAEAFVDDISAIGFLGLGLQLCLFIIELISSVDLSVFPSLVEYHTLKDERFSKSMELAWRYTNLILFPLIGAASVLTAPSISILIGNNFLPSAKIFLLFLPAVVFFTWGFVHQQILYVFEEKYKLFAKPVLEFFIFFSLAWLLLPHYGIAAAPFSLCAGALGGYLFARGASRPLFKISRYWVSIIKPLLATGPIILIMRAVPITGVFSLIAAALAGGLSYFCMMWVIKGITLADMKRVRAVFMK